MRWSTLARAVSVSKGSHGRRDWRDEIQESSAEKRDLGFESCRLISNLESRVLFFFLEREKETALS